MPSELNIAVFEGDGIGPEVMAPTLSILKEIASLSGEFEFRFTSLPAGATHYQKSGTSLPDASLDKAKEADAILLSAMGLPDIRYPDGTEISPQIELRQELGLYAGLRPVRLSPGQASPLKLHADQSVDFMLIRESTEGLFWSRGQGYVDQDEARETLLITRRVSEKLFSLAFRLAERRNASGIGHGCVTCVDKANVFRAFAFFRSIFDEVATTHKDLKSDHLYVDAAALRMVQAPWSLDVLVTENMFGDILSDLGAGLMGGLGLAPSADLGDEHAVFQPCHGSAPDIAGQGIANPVAMILSGAMMLDWLGDRKNLPRLAEAAIRLRAAADQVLVQGQVMTPDLGGEDGTDAMAQAIRDNLKGLF
ncbi:MAG: isocitrate/isopropylmalate family dehydrogenase [Pseudomonadota bacterium]